MSNINFTYTNLTPFKWYVLENFPFIEADFDALTNWQLFCKLGKEINKIIPAVNKVGQQTEDLTNFVTNYFDNLDVQDEINNKLDQMVQDGTLQEIITQYLQINGLLTFNSVSDMLNSTNLINGSIATTNGYYTFNDGGSARYKIRNITNEDVINNLTLLKLNNSETLVAELIETKTINVKQYGAKGDGVTDDTQSFKLAIKNSSNKTIIINDGNYLISQTINCPKNVNIEGKNCTIIINNNITAFNINNKNKMKNIKFQLNNFNTNVFEISFATIDQWINDLDNNLNINIDNISFNFNNTQNQGNCFLICADSTEENNKYNGTGFWGIFLNNIFIEGMFFSAIKQYVNDAQENWITSCYYENFNISKSGIYGFLGTKDENNLTASNISDGDFIVFNNWAMQASNQKTKNMFYFTQLGKILNNIKPWDWNNYAEAEELPINVLYRQTINRQPIYVQGLLQGITKNVQITGSTFEVDGSDYQRYILSIIGHYTDYESPYKNEYYKNKIIKMRMSNKQSIEANTRTIVNFDQRLINSVGWGLTWNNGVITVNEPINHVRINTNIGFKEKPASIGIYIMKNNSEILNQCFLYDQSCISLSTIAEVEQGDTISVQCYVPTASELTNASSPNNEFSIEILD